MLKHIGLKEVLAIPMTRGDYNEYRGWELPIDEDGADEGFLVEYIDGGKSNHQAHSGYVSWSPVDVFEAAYKPIDGMTFGFALEALKRGFKVARKGWNGKNMWLLYVPGSPNIRPVAGTPYSNAGITADIDIGAHIDMFTAQGTMQPGWLASQSDMLAEDWTIEVIHS